MHRFFHITFTSWDWPGRCSCLVFLYWSIKSTKTELWVMFTFKLWTNVRDPDLEMQWFQRFLRIGTQLASSYSPGSFASQPWGQSCKNCSPQHREWNQAHRTPEKSHQRETLSHFAGSFCWCCSGHVFHINEHCFSHAHLAFFFDTRTGTGTDINVHGWTPVMAIYSLYRDTVSQNGTRLLQYYIYIIIYIFMIIWYKLI